MKYFNSLLLFSLLFFSGPSYSFLSDVPQAVVVSAYSPTIGGAPTTSISNLVYYVDSDNILHINGVITISAAGSATGFTVTLPGSYTIDTSRLGGGTSTGSSDSSILGKAEWLDSGVAWKWIVPVYVSSNVVGFHESPGLLLSSGLASGDGIKMDLNIPIN